MWNQIHRVKTNANIWADIDFILPPKEPKNKADPEGQKWISQPIFTPTIKADTKGLKWYHSANFLDLDTLTWVKT